MTEALVRSSRECADALRDFAAARRAVRICGRATRPRFLAPAPPETATVSLRAMNAIERLERDDLTCSVQPGVACSDLAAELRRANLELDCLDENDPGTIGGLYASDPLPSPSAHAATPRSTLLGMDAALMEGIEFRSGARVVKSVAGFDVHRLLIGSRGRLFAATLLHLKLRPMPRAKIAFTSAPMELRLAAQLLHALRVEATSPKRLVLARMGDAWAVRGVASGRLQQAKSLLSRHALRESDHAPSSHLPSPQSPRQLIAGVISPSCIEELCRGLPNDAQIVAHGGGSFEMEAEPDFAQTLLDVVADMGGAAAIACGPSHRIGLGTPLDQGAERLQRELRSALDPAGLLA